MNEKSGTEWGNGMRALSAEELDGLRKKVRVVVLEQEQHDGGPFNFGESYADGSFDEVLHSLIEIRESIPEEYRDKARCSVDSVGGYEGSHYAIIKVSYDRPETDDEVIVRIKGDMAAAAELEAREKRVLAKLQAKYQLST